MFLLALWVGFMTRVLQRAAPAPRYFQDAISGIKKIFPIEEKKPDKNLVLCGRSPYICARLLFNNQPLL